MKKRILIKALFTEKTEKLTDKFGKYTFIVSKDANKIEIKKAVEDTFNVGVKKVNTLIMPGKSKVRNTKTGLVKGKTSSFKKAIITLNEGEELDFFGSDEE